MKYYEIFKKIVEWMLSKDGIDTNTVIKMADITMEEYQIIIEANKLELKKLRNSTIANVQNFNKKHSNDYFESRAIANLPETSEADKIENIDIDLTDPLLYSTNSFEELQERKAAKRKHQKDQEELFYDVLKQLHNVVPDHMKFEIFVKLK